MNSQKMDTQTCRLLLIENKADLDIKDVSIRDVLNSLMWDWKCKQSTDNYSFNGCRVPANQPMDCTSKKRRLRKAAA